MGQSTVTTLRPRVTRTSQWKELEIAEETVKSWYSQECRRQSRGAAGRGLPETRVQDVDARERGVSACRESGLVVRVVVTIVQAGDPEDTKDQVRGDREEDAGTSACTGWQTTHIDEYIEESPGKCWTSGLL